MKKNRSWVSWRLIYGLPVVIVAIIVCVILEAWDHRHCDEECPECHPAGGGV